MPMAYGGGIRTLDQVRRLIRCGVEKVVINSAALDDMRVIRDAASVFGSQAVVGAVDVKRTLFGGLRVVGKSATVECKFRFEEHLTRLQEAGAGEIFVNCVDRDGMMAGYDLDLVRSAALCLTVPLVVCGGAGTPKHLLEARDAGASALAAGSMFVFHGKHRAVLIIYPTEVRI